MRQQGSRGIVVPFVAPIDTASRRARRRTPGGPAHAAAPPAADPGRDEVLNAEWDQLLDLTLQACTWRDPESLAAVHLVLARLTRETLREWSG